MKDPFTHDDDLTIRMPDGYRLFTLEVDQMPGTRGRQIDGPTEARLKNALFVETYLTFCKFQVLDLRSYRPNLYPAEALVRPDERSQPDREADAMAVMGDNVGNNTLEYCLTEGRKRAPKWFNMTAANLKTYMQTTHLEYSRNIAEGQTDKTIIQCEKFKIAALVLGVNRAAELRAHQRRLNREIEKKRPPKIEIATLNPLGSAKHPLESFDQAYLIAVHAGVDPTDLWFDLRRYSPLFRLVVYTNFDVRKEPLTPKQTTDRQKLYEAVYPYFEGWKIPKDPVLRYMLRTMAGHSDALSRFSDRFGFSFAGPHGRGL
jgi:hypothetical protein